MAIAIAIAAFLAAAHEAPVLPDWMAGCWEQRSGDQWTEECWSRPRGGIMIGYSRAGQGEKLGEWEVMQIVLDQKAGEGPIVRMAFWTSPQGNDRTLFAWSPANVPGVSFFNVANDYPQRIRYWREGGNLMAEIAMQDGSKPKRWRYEPVTP